MTAPVTAPDTRLSRIAAHLKAAVFLAAAWARADTEPLLSVWADLTFELELAEVLFADRLSGPVIAPEHPDPSTAVRAALVEAGRLVPDVDLPFDDLVGVTARLALLLAACDSALAGRPGMLA